MEKKITLILFLILLSSFVFAASLNQVKVRSDVPLNENLTVSGYYADPDQNAGVLCSFKIFDTQTSDKYLVKRLSDEYTFSDGSFSTEYKIIEPLFQRGFDYNVMVCCNIACYDQNFHVSQKDDIFLGYSSASIINDVLFFIDPNLIGIIIFFVALLLILYVAVLKK